MTSAYTLGFPQLKALGLRKFGELLGLSLGSCFCCLLLYFDFWKCLGAARQIPAISAIGAVNPGGDTRVSCCLHDKQTRQKSEKQKS
jgi:hypothetical protein